MDFIFLLIGVIIGIVVTRWVRKPKKIYGYIDVDRRSGLCRVHISSEELGNSNAKHAIFEIRRDAELHYDDVDSRDELPL